MRKFPVIVALVLIVVGGAYALVANLLPDNNQFPRIPTGDGTIGGAIAKMLGVTDLANYLGDGTVANTNMLSGVTADKLLKGNTCANMTDVWLSTDATGKPVCGSNGGMLATTIGTINTIVGIVTAYRADGTTRILTGSDPILEGDIIQTSPGATITIAFSDLSLIRLDGGSTVSLDSGVTTSGQSIAYAILNNGGLWGRVLTETGGYYIGNSDIVAGVRGTSISYERDRWANNPSITSGGSGWIITPGPMSLGHLKIFHSTQSGVTVECRDGSSKFIGAGSGAYLMVYPGAMCNGVSVSPIVFAGMPNMTFYTNDTGAANNTVADIEYMTKLLKDGGLTPSKATRIQNEINVTKPTTVIEKDDICPDEVVTTTIKKVYWDIFSGSTIGPCQSALAIADYSIGSANMYFSGGEAVSPGVSTLLKNPGDSITDDGYFGGMGCNETFWNEGSWITDWEGRGTLPQNLLLPGSLIASDYSRFFVENGISTDYTTLYITNNTPQKCKGYISGGQWDRFQYAGALYGVKSQSFGDSTAGIPITGTGYISYPLPLFPSRVGSLGGKKITITLSGTPTTSMTLVDFGYTGSTSYRIQKTGSSYMCKWSFPACNLSVSGNDISFTAPLASQIKYFVIGNNKDAVGATSSLTTPIGATIKKIQISN